MLITVVVPVGMVLDKLLGLPLPILIVGGVAVWCVVAVAVAGKVGPWLRARRERDVEEDQ